MAVKVIIGAFWGDEGKGKCAHYEAADAKVSIRSTGGANAGCRLVNHMSHFFEINIL